VGRLEVLVGSTGATTAHAPVTAAKKGTFRPAARVLRMSTGASSSKPVMTAEDQLPMGDTGTYGKF
jgi:hypothetical protein